MMEKIFNFQFSISKFKKGLAPPLESVCFSRAGFTLLEIAVSIAVLLILAVIIWSGFNSYRESYSLNQSVEAGLGFLKSARTRTLASQNASQYGVHFETGKIVLFAGAVYNPSSPLDTFIFPALVQISAINLAGGSQEVLFQRLTGKTAQPGIVTFASRRNPSQTRTIQIFDSGLFEVQ